MSFTATRCVVRYERHTCLGWRKYAGLALAA